MGQDMVHIGKVLQEHLQKSTPCQRNFESEEEHRPTLEEKRVKWLLELGGVTDLNNTFDKLRCPKGFKPTLDAFKELATGTAPWHMLMVYGGTGNGKTLCCQALVIALYDRGLKVQRERWVDIIRFTLKAAFRTTRAGQPSYGDVFDQLQNKPYLIIDDVGMGSAGGNWEWGELEDIVDYRLENKLFTVITSNLDGKEIPPRIISRFKDRTHCRLICNTAADFRPLLEVK